MYKLPHYNPNHVFMLSNALLNLAPRLLAPLGNSLPYIWACYPSPLGILDVGVVGGVGADLEQKGSKLTF